MQSSSKLIEKFNKELKYRLSIKANKRNPPEKVLLDAFKYFDIKNQGMGDYKMFSQVVKMKLGINIFTEEQITMAFEYYLQSLESAQNCIFYRDLVGHLYNVNVTNQSQTQSQQDQKSLFTETKSFTRNKYDTLDETDAVKKLIEYIIFKLRKDNLSSFLNLYLNMRSQDQGLSGFLSFEGLSKSLRESGIELPEENVEKIWTFFQNKMGRMEYEKMQDLLCLNFNQNRKNYVRQAFDKLDSNQSKQVSLNLLEELFFARNHVWVKQGRQTIEEIHQEFMDYLKSYKTQLAHSEMVNANEFLNFFKFISPVFENEKEFKEFLEFSFRYNELRNLERFQQKSQQSKIQYGRSDCKRSEIVSVRTNLQPHNVMLIIEEAVSKKGNMGYINFFKCLRGNDYDRDNFLYFKEWKKSIQEQRVELTDNQLQSLFDNFAVSQYKMNYDLFLEKLVPSFDQRKQLLIKDLYDNLVQTEGKNELSFYKIQNSFLPRQHPDFKEGRRQDFEIKNEFLNGLQGFLVNYQGNHVQMNLNAFNRFFEFYCRDWSDEYFEKVIQNSFNTIRRKEMLLSQKEDAPFATDYNRKDQSVYDSQNRYYQEFKSKNQAYKVSSPFYTDTNEAFKKKQNVQQNQDQQEDINRYLQKEEQIKQLEESEIQRQFKQEPTHDYDLRSRRSRLSNKSNTRKSNSRDRFKHSDDQDLLSEKQDQLSVYRMNKMIQDNLKDQDQRVYDNVNNRQLGVNTPTGRLLRGLRESKKMISILELEYELTNKSDSKGNVNWENFSSIFEQLNLMQGLTKGELQEIYSSNLNDDRKLHVQTFANDIRDQMSEERENTVIDLFDRLCHNKQQEMVKVDQLRDSFNPQKFIYSSDESVQDRKEMFEYMIDLFVCLNLTIKNRNYFDLDDFMYFFDNFSFYIQNDQEFQHMAKNCFKQLEQRIQFFHPKIY